MIMYSPKPPLMLRHCNQAKCLCGTKAMAGPCSGRNTDRYGICRSLPPRD